LRKKAKESLASDATTEAAILLNVEVPATQEQLRPATQEQLRDLITREATNIANQQCNALRNDIKNLKKSLYPKSSKKRGGAFQESREPHKKRKTVGTKKHLVQETATHHGPESPISQETKAMDGPRSPVATVTIEIFNANHNRIIISSSSPEIDTEELQDQDAVRKTTMATTNDVDRAPDQGSGTAMVAEGAIAPPTGRLGNRSSLRIHRRL
jgi:hypothetical protein